MGVIMHNDVQYCGGGGGGVPGGTEEIPITIMLTQAEYNALTQAEKHDITKVYFITDAQSGGGGSEIDDTTTVNNKTWSSNKISTELNTKLESIPIANSSTLGGVKIGSNINVASDGTISTHAPYSLPTASSSTKGGITVGAGLSMNGTALELKNLIHNQRTISVTSKTIEPKTVGNIRVYLENKTQRDQMIDKGYVVGANITDLQMLTVVRAIAENQGTYGAIDVSIYNTWDTAQTVTGVTIFYAYWS